MIPDIKRLLVVSFAMVLFLCAASTTPGLTWRANPAQPALTSR